MYSSRAVASTSRAVHTSSKASASLRPIFPGSAATKSKSGGSVTADTSSSSVRVAPNAEWNTRSVDVSGLPELKKAEFKKAHVGRPYRLPSLKPLISSDDAPRSLTKDLAMTSQPTTVLRQIAVDLVSALKSSQGIRKQLIGKSGSGRTCILLQAIAACRSDGWAVLYIPNAHKLVDGTFAFEPAEGSSPIYQQPSLAQYLLQEFLRQNPEWAKTADAELLKALQDGSKDAKIAMSALETLLQSTASKPLLIAIDSAEALQGVSQYRDANADLVHSRDLAIPKLLNEYATGKQQLQAGAILLATDRATGALQGIDSQQVGGLSMQEAIGIYEHLAETELLSSARSDSDLMEAYVSSDGNARLFSRGLRAVPGGTSRGVIEKGRARGVAQRADKVLTVSV